MLKGVCDLTALQLETFWTRTKPVPSSFLISTIWFLILTNAFRNGYVFACSTAAETNDMSEHGTVRYMAKTTPHSSTADWNGFLSDVTRLVAT